MIKVCVKCGRESGWLDWNYCPFDGKKLKEE